MRRAHAIALVFGVLAGACTAIERRPPPPADRDGRLAGLEARLAPAMSAIDGNRFAEALHTALEFGRPGGPVAWRNPDTGANGEVVAAAPRRVGDRVCRDVVATTTLGARTDVRRGTACGAGDGRWRPARIDTNRPLTTTMG